jgi:hypothetical protein
MASPEPVLSLQVQSTRNAEPRLELYWRIHQLADTAFNAEPS